MNNSMYSNSTLLSSFTEHLPNVQYVLCYAAESINLILGFPTNVYVLWLIMTGAGGTTASEFFVLNLAVSDVLYCLFSVFVLVNMHIPITALAYLAAFSFGFLITGRPVFQCCICVERYLAVVHPVVFLKYKPLRYRVGCCSVVWLMVLGSCCLCMFKTFKPAFFYSLFAQSMIYFLLMSFCCLSVLCALKRPGPGDGARDSTNRIKMKAFKIILIILVYAVASQLPLAVMAQIISNFDDNELFSVMSICVYISVISGYVQPLLYLHRVGKLPCIRGL